MLGVDSHCWGGYGYGLGDDDNKVGNLDNSQTAVAEEGSVMAVAIHIVVPTIRIHNDTM